MKKQILVFLIILLSLSTAKAIIYENGAIKAEIKEIDDSIVLNYREAKLTDVSIILTYQGDNKFRIVQTRLKYPEDYRDDPIIPELVKRTILYDQTAVIPEQFAKIDLTGISIFAKIKSLSDNKLELSVTKDVEKYVDLSIENVKFSEDELKFEVCNRGNEPSIKETKQDVMIMPNFVDGGSENVIIGENFKENIAPNDCQEFKIDTDELKIKPEKITRIRIFVPYYDYAWGANAPDIIQSNNQINANIENNIEQTPENAQNTQDTNTNAVANPQQQNTASAESTQITIQMTETQSTWKKITKFFKKLFG